MRLDDTSCLVNAHINSLSFFDRRARGRFATVKKLVIGIAFLLLGGCGPVRVAAPAVPLLERSQAASVALAADDAWRLAMSVADASALPAVFAARALDLARARVAEMRRRGARLEEQLLSRRLVHWRGGRGEGQAVLEVRAVQRLMFGTAPAAVWAQVLRQWSLGLAWVAGGWRVVAAGELAPDSWWRA
jgi:hypothetical protein